MSLQIMPHILVPGRSRNKDTGRNNANAEIHPGLSI